MNIAYISCFTAVLYDILRLTKDLRDLLLIEPFYCIHHVSRVTITKLAFRFDTLNTIS